MIVPCPICHGCGLTNDPDYGEKCMACQGSGTMEVDGPTFARMQTGYCPNGHPMYTPTEKEELVSLRNQGLTWKVIAEKMDRSHSSVRNKSQSMHKSGEWVDISEKIGILE